MIILIFAHNVLHNIAQNSSDNLLYYFPDNHLRSGVVYQSRWKCHSSVHV